MSSAIEMVQSVTRFNPKAVEFIPRKPFSAQARLIARIRLETRLACSLALRKATPKFNVYATRFHPRSAAVSTSRLNPRAPSFMPRILRCRGLALRRFRFNAHASEFHPKNSKLNPDAKIFIPNSSTKKSIKWNSQAKEFTPARKSTRFNASAKPFVPKKATSSISSTVSSPGSTTASSTSKKPTTTLSPNPTSGSYVFNLGVVNAPKAGVQTRRRVLDGDAFMILPDDAVAPKKVKILSSEEIQKQKDLVNQLKINILSSSC